MSQQFVEWMFLGLIFFIITLIVLALVAEQHAERCEMRAKESFEKLESLLYALQQAEIKTGVCCCGDSMDRHDIAYNCGHSPVDMFDHYGLPVLKDAMRYVERVKSGE